MELLHNPEVWVLVGFLVFFGLLGRHVLEADEGWSRWPRRQGPGTAERGRQLCVPRPSAMLDLYRGKQEQAVKDAADILGRGESPGRACCASPVKTI